MAIAFARVSIHTRTHGQSSVAGAAYRSGSKLIDERTGETHNYESRTDVLHTEILLPEGASSAFKDRHYLWNTVEALEKRKDSQLAKDVILALPKELNLEQQIELARHFAQYHFVSKGLVADIAIHDHSDGNPHAHIYITTRRLLGDSFDRYKARDLNPLFANGKGGKGFVMEQEYWGEQWREFQNQYFDQENIDLTVDENHLITQRHAGRIRENENHYIQEENQLKREAVFDIALNDPDNLINLLSLRYSVFTEKQLMSVLFKSTESREQFQEVLLKIKAHNDIVCLGTGDDGILRYTTRSNYLKEANMVDHAHSLKQSRKHQVSKNYFKDIGERYSLSNEQAQALEHIVRQEDITAIVGRAGTGKSYLMRAAREVWQDADFDVIGVTVSGIAAKGLQEGSSIPSSTIASFKQQLLRGKLKLSSKNIVVMDEAGMTDLHDMALVVEKVRDAKAKLVLIGDPEQLQPINAGAPFRALVERIGFAEIQTIQRQNDAGDRVASQSLALSQIEQAWQHYENKGAVHWHDTSQTAKQNLIQHWALELQSETVLPNLMILAHQNKDVQELNRLARGKLIEKKWIDYNQQQTVTIAKRIATIDSWNCQMVKENIALAPGDRLLFRKNDKNLGVHNGEFATVLSIEKEQLKVKLDTQKEITIDMSHYNEFDYGYAATVHKSQGVTKDHVFVYANGKGWDRHLAYVALTRHREKVELHLDRENFATAELAQGHFKRKRIKDNVIDWPVSYAARRGFDPESLIGRFITKMEKVKTAIKDHWQRVNNFSKSQEKPKKQTAFKSLNEINWQSPEYREEWEELRKIDDKNIQWMVKFYDLSRNKKDPKELQAINASITKLADKVCKDRKTLNMIEKIAPNLAKVLQLFDRTILKSKGLNKENEGQ